MPARGSSKDKNTEPEAESPDSGHESQPDEVGGHWENDDTTGDRRWVPDKPKS